MPVEVGQIVRGTVTGVKKFGAFIKLPDGSTGLCHISEVSNSYVKEIEDHLSMNQEVDVKVIGIDEKGKINLSIKQTQPPAPQQARRAPQHHQKKEESKDFESLMNDFMKNSDKKLKTIKRKKTRRGNGFNTRK